jgi:hypothetical protein
MRATGMNEPSYKEHPSPQVIRTEERGRILGS